MMNVAASDTEIGYGHRHCKFHLKASSQRLNTNIGKVFLLGSDHIIKLSFSKQGSQWGEGGDWSCNGYIHKT